MWDVPKDIDLEEHWRNLYEQRALYNLELLLNKKRKFEVTEKQNIKIQEEIAHYERS